MVRQAALVVAVGSFVGLAAAVLTEAGLLGGLIRGSVFSVALIGIEALLVWPRIARRQRRTRLLGSFLAYIVFLGLALAVALQTSAWLVSDPAIDAALTVDGLALLGYALLVRASFSATRLNPMTSLANHLLGREAPPSVERRIFLFADVQGSSALETRLGQDTAQALLGDLFGDLRHVVQDHGGELWQTIGDKLIASWPAPADGPDHRPARCGLAMQDRLATREAYYSTRFAAVPQILVALHGGDTAVLGGGDGKDPVAYRGGAFDATWELEREARRLDCKVVASADYLALAGQPADVSSEDLGALTLRRLGETLQAFALTSPAQRPEGAP